MSRKVSISLLCSLLSALGGCEKSATTKPASDSQSRSSAGSPNVSQSVPIIAKRKPDQPTFDACGLITKEEIEAIQGSPITDMKSSARTDGPFRVSQCFYTAAEFSKSVSVAVTQPDPNNPGKRTSREFWKETFGRYSGQEKERDDAGNIPAPEHRRPEVEREASVPPKRIPAIGDEAYWTVGPGGAPMRILLVEDHADSRRCMHRLLESRGHTVHSVGDAQSAIKLGEREEFDLLITDIGLPDRSGLELLRELRQRAPELPAIALSGFGMPSDVVNSKEAGFAELFVKPVDLQKLHAVINTLAGRNGRGKRLKPPKQTHPRKSAL